MFSDKIHLDCCFGSVRGMSFRKNLKKNYHRVLITFYRQFNCAAVIPDLGITAAQYFSLLVYGPPD